MPEELEPHSPLAREGLGWACDSGIRLDACAAVRYTVRGGNTIPSADDPRHSSIRPSTPAGSRSRGRACRRSSK
jgi:hypothetical protein